MGWLSSLLEWAAVVFPTVIGLMQWVLPIHQPTWRHKVIISILCIVASTLIYWQQQVAHREHFAEIAASNQQLADLKSKLDEGEKKRNRMIVNLASKHPLMDALGDLDKRPPIPIEPPEMFDLDSSKTALENRRLEKQAADAKSNLIESQMESQMSEKALKECSPVFEYVITALSSYLAALAKDNGDMVTSTYRGIPSVIPNVVILKNYAVIEMQQHPDWKFDISFNCLSLPSTANVVMKIHCGSEAEASFEYRMAEKRFFADIKINDKESFEQSFDLDHYKSNMHDLLSVLIGVQYECYPIMQPSPIPNTAASPH